MPCGVGLMRRCSCFCHLLPKQVWGCRLAVYEVHIERVCNSYYPGVTGVGLSCNKPLQVSEWCRVLGVAEVVQMFYCY